MSTFKENDLVYLKDSNISKQMFRVVKIEKGFVKIEKIGTDENMYLETKILTLFHGNVLLKNIQNLENQLVCLKKAYRESC